MHYRHTQVGWVILGLTAAVGTLVWTRLPAEVASAAAIPLLITAAVILLVFSSLSVEVDHQAIRLRFGVGLVRKRIALADVSSWHAVRNPWYSGWGIRLGPGGVLWNVSGFDAVELVLASGERFRVGTDEPLALATAITQAKGIAAPPLPAEERLAWPRSRTLPAGAPAAELRDRELPGAGADAGAVRGDGARLARARPALTRGAPFPVRP